MSALAPLRFRIRLAAQFSMPIVPLGPLAGSIEEEASALAAAIKSLVDSGRPPAEVAVLFRCMSLAGRYVYQPLADALTR